MYSFIAFLCLFFRAILAQDDNIDISHCAANIVENCKFDEYFVSTLEIVERELSLSRGKAEDYLLRQVCNNANEELMNFKKCVFKKVGHLCWKWTGVFDSIHHLPKDKYDLGNLAKRYEQVFVILEHNICSDADMRSEYIEIRSCSHRGFRSGGTSFHDKYIKCITGNDPNPIQELMNKMDLCVGNNRGHACYLDASLGDQCDKVRDALTKHAQMHAGHGGFHEEELKMLEFVIQAASADQLRLPKKDECKVNPKAREILAPWKIYYGIFLLSLMVIGALCFYFRDDLAFHAQRIFQLKG